MLIIVLQAPNIIDELILFCKLVNSEANDVFFMARDYTRGFSIDHANLNETREKVLLKHIDPFWCRPNREQHLFP